MAEGTVMEGAAGAEVTHLRSTALGRLDSCRRHVGDITACCPFCGETAAFGVMDERGTALETGQQLHLYLVCCIRCGCQGPTLESAALAVAAWNHRAR